MIHNGIEYADMQLIAETYALMQGALGLDYPAMQAAFAEWNRGELDSYLIEITADILGKRDPETGQPMVEVILDRAGQKGTGGWAVAAALELGVPAPTIAEAVAARSLSALKAERVAAAERLAGPAAGPTRERLPLATLRDALLAAKLCAYAQGFAVMAGAGRGYGWQLDFGTIATIWRGGCIIRARFLDRIRQAYERDPALANLLLDPYFSELIGSRPGEPARGRGGRRPPRRAGAGAGLGARLFRRLPLDAAAGQPDPGAARLFRRPHLRAGRPAGQLPHRLVGALRRAGRPW